MKKLLAGVVGVMALAFSSNAFAQSSVADDQGQANNLVTQTASAQVSSTTIAQVSTGISAAIPTPSVGSGGTFQAPGAGGAIGTTSDAGQHLFNTRALAKAGEAAGNGGPRAGVWVQVANTWVEGDDTGGEFDGTALAGTLGFDYKVTDRAVVGIAIGVEDSDIDTDFNNGTFEGSGFSFTPYVGVTLGKSWTLSGLISYATVEYDTSANNNATTASFDADRILGAINLEGNYGFNKVRVSPRIGVLYMTEEQDAHTDSAGTAVAGNTIDLGRASAGATIGYNLGRVEPYVRAIAEYDFTKEDPVQLANGNFSSDDEFGINAAIGANFALGNRLVGTLEGSAGSLGRTNLDTYTLTGRIRYSW